MSKLIIADQSAIPGVIAQTNPDGGRELIGIVPQELNGKPLWKPTRKLNRRLVRKLLLIGIDVPGCTLDAGAVPEVAQPSSHV